MKLNGIFKDGMVFQRDREIRVFGEAPEEKFVAAYIRDAEGNAVASGDTDEVYEDGFFLICIPALRAGGPYEMEVVAGSKRTRFKITNIYVGEVWLAAGQSNMEYPLGRSENAKRVIQNVHDTNIHFYNIPVYGNYDDEQALAEENSKWEVINSDTCYDMSAVAFYFARKIETFIKEHHVEGKDLHFGIIGCYLGGTSIASWQSMESLEATKEGRKYIEMYRDELNQLPEADEEKAVAEYKKQLAEYKVKIEGILKENPYISYLEADRKIGKTIPWPPPPTPTSIRRPSALFDTMLLRIVPYGLRGVIFYQGETDADDHADEYAVVLKSMINEWREAFWDEKLPFIFCQLPMYTSKDRKYMEYDDMNWPKLREQQSIVARSMTNVYMAVLTDCGEFDNLHPADKRTPGERLAQLALKFIYGYESLPAVAPYVIFVRQGEGVEITFGGDFKSLNLEHNYSAAQSGFELAGPNGKFFPAEASVGFDGKTIVCTCKKVKRASKVRYAYYSYGTANLISDKGLAAEPFQIDIDNF
ncbi:MAG: sialate O-acetylesterase [Saccharofermentans sp.]|nr:sialate O-acetylesterase [Saccharofermentans sp.]